MGHLAALKRLGGDTSPLSATAPAGLQRLKPVQPEDAVFVYFSGHGLARQNRFYLILHDLGYQGARTQLDAPGLDTILSHSISDRELEQAVDAGQIVFVIDACNSGHGPRSRRETARPHELQGLGATGV